MLKNYILTMFRNINRSKGYYFLNVTSLALGIACFIIISGYLVQETGYDEFFKDKDQIYRIAMNARISERYMETASVMPALVPNLKEKFAEVEDGTRILKLSRPIYMSSGEEGFYEQGVLCVDKNFFDVFSYEIIEGDADLCFESKDQIVLTESTSRKYFGEEPALGKTLRSNNKLDLTVSAVIADPPGSTHLEFNMLRSMEMIRFYYGEEFLNHTTRLSIHSYVKLIENADIDKMNKKICTLINEMNDNRLEENGITLNAYLQKITDIHLHSNLINEIVPNGSYSHVLIFFAVAVFILVIAFLNFINLSTVISAGRYKEISIRKICGSSRKHLRIQFIYESILIVALSVVIALGFVEIMVPQLIEITNMDIGIRNLMTVNNFILLGVFTVLTGIITGIYPAFKLSALDSLNLMKESDHRKGSKSVVRNVLVILQFIIAVLLISSIFIINDQLNYIQNKDMGYNKETVVYLALNSEIRENYNPPSLQLHNKGCNSLHRPALLLPFQLDPPSQIP